MSSFTALEYVLSCAAGKRSAPVSSRVTGSGTRRSVQRWSRLRKELAAITERVHLVDHNSKQVCWRPHAYPLPRRTASLATRYALRAEH